MIITLASASEWLGAAALVGALAALLGLVLNRSLLAVHACLIALTAFCAIGLAAFARSGAAIALGALGVGLAPVIALNVLSLTSRSAERRAGAGSWFVIGLLSLAGLGAVAAIAGVDLDVAGATPAAFSSQAAAWIAVLVGGAAMSAFGLLAHGERGARSEGGSAQP